MEMRAIRFRKNAFPKHEGNIYGFPRLYGFLLVDIKCKDNLGANWECLFMKLQKFAILRVFPFLLKHFHTKMNVYSKKFLIEGEKRRVKFSQTSGSRKTRVICMLYLI